jgi:outer membrane protein assembly factor BamD
MITIHCKLHRIRVSRILFLIQLCILVVLLNLSGCAKIKSIFDFSKEADAAGNLPVKTLVTKGMDDYAVGKYFTALEYFQEILDRYPFTPEATLAELKAADCKYFLEHYAEALVLYQEFEDRHPTNEAMPYVLYQKAMCNYKQIDRVDRDISGAEQAIQLFGQLLRAYPNSPYTDEAKARIKAAREFIANHEYFVVEYYLRTDKISEAETRLKYILAMYPDSSISPRAKEMLARIQAGNPPKSKLTSWLPKMSLPDWTKFSSTGTEENPGEAREE